MISGKSAINDMIRQVWDILYIFFFNFCIHRLCKKHVTFHLYAFQQ